jgi:hypothetical protein
VRRAGLEHLRRFASWLDDGIRIPGTSLRIGLDPILGLVPGLGDVAGACLALAILVEAGRRGTSRATLIRIAGNIALDALVGAVPLIGDVFDVAWKANLRNVALIERHVAGPAAARQADRLLVVALSVSLLLFCVALVVGGLLLTARLVRVVVGY